MSCLDSGIQFDLCDACAAGDPLQQHKHSRSSFVQQCDEEAPRLHDVGAPDSQLLESVVALSGSGNVAPVELRECGESRQLLLADQSHQLLANDMKVNLNKYRDPARKAWAGSLGWCADRSSVGNDTSI